MKFFDVKTNELVQSNDPNQLMDMYMQGQIGADPNSLYTLVDQNGVYQGDFAPDQLTHAFKYGYRLPNQNEMEKAQYYKDNDNTMGAMKAAGINFTDEATFGLAKHIYPELADEESKQLLDMHPGAATAGSVAGFGASLFTGGAVWKGATKAGKATEALIRGEGLASKIIGKAAGGGVEGALSYAPYIPNEYLNLDEDSEGNAEHILANGLLAAGLGSGLRLAGGAAYATARGAKNKFLLKGKTPQQFIDSSAVKQYIYGTNKKNEIKLSGLYKEANKSNSFTPKDYFDELGLNKNVGESWEELQQRFSKVRDGVKDSQNNVIEKGIGHNIGDLMEKYSLKTTDSLENILKSLDDQIIPLQESAATVPVAKQLKRFIQEFENTSGKKILTDNLYQNSSEFIKRGTFFEIANIDEAINVVRNSRSLKEASKNLAKLDTRVKYGEMSIDDLADDFYKASKADQPFVSELWKQEQAMRDIVEKTPWMSRTDYHRNLGDLKETIKKHKESAIDKTDLVKLKDLNRKYRYLTTHMDVIEDSLHSQSSRRRISLTDYMSGGAAGAAGGIVGGTLGGAPGYVAGSIGSSLLVGGINNFMRENYHGLVSKYGNHLGTTITDLNKKVSGAIIANGVNNLFTAGKGRIAAGSLYEDIRKQQIPLLTKNKGESNDELSLRSLYAFLEQAETNGAWQDDLDLLDDNLKNTKGQLGNKATTLISLLKENMPLQEEPKPFQKQKPLDKNQLKDFRSVFNSAVNPYSILNKLKTKTATKKDVSTVKKLYPKIYQQITMELAAAGQNNKLDAAEQAYYGTLFSDEFGFLLDNISTYQSIYQQTQQEATGGAATATTTGGRPKTQQIDLKNITRKTEGQRLSADNEE